MADPLLTSLCAICHVSAPKYKCPRCNIQTCSVQCIKKHKAWSECSGERDPTTYVPPAQLRTVAGVNHDYNFLHGLGMSMERTERVFVQDKKIMREEDLRPKTVMQPKWTTGRDGRKRRTMVPRQGGNAEAREKRFERHLAHTSCARRWAWRGRRRTTPRSIAARARSTGRSSGSSSTETINPHPNTKPKRCRRGFFQKYSRIHRFTEHSRKRGARERRLRRDNRGRR